MQQPMWETPRLTHCCNMNTVNQQSLAPLKSFDVMQTLCSLVNPERAEVSTGNFRWNPQYLALGFS